MPLYHLHTNKVTDLWQMPKISAVHKIIDEMHKNKLSSYMVTVSIRKIHGGCINHIRFIIKGALYPNLGIADW